MAELEAELAKADNDKAEAELGDFLFSVINAARLYKINPDNALERTNRKFMSRFNYIEAKAKEAGKNIKDTTETSTDTTENILRSCIK